jgi:undecaprenyl-diphosphatase
MNPFDESILHFLNGCAHRSPVFDEFVVLVCMNNFLKGALIFTIVWYLWFQNEGNKEKREYLLVGVSASFVGLVVAKILTLVIHRSRPFNNPQLELHIPYGMHAVAWEGLNSFPSDHAVLFFALATGIFLASRPIGWLVYSYVTLVICLPRVYLGIHFPTDILAGAIIGVSTAWLAHFPGIRQPLTRGAFRWIDRRPGLFYAFSFLLTYLVCELFDPAISIVKFMLRAHLPG